MSGTVQVYSLVQYVWCALLKNSFTQLVLGHLQRSFQLL